MKVYGVNVAQSDFIQRHLGPDNEQCAAMLDELGLRSIDELIAHALPPVLSGPESMEHPHLIEHQVIRNIDDRGYGKLDIPDIPLRFFEFPDALDLQAPFLGEQNKEVFGEHGGLSSADIEALENEEGGEVEAIARGRYYYRVYVGQQGK